MAGDLRTHHSTRSVNGWAKWGRCGYATLSSALLVPLCCLAVGCSGSSSTVTGVVKYQSEPIQEGTIQFVPSDGKGTSVLIAEGTYSVEQQRGLKPGEYQVRIYAEKGTGRFVAVRDGINEVVTQRVQEMVQFIPVKYNTKTILRTTLSAGKNIADFSLE